MPVLAWVVMRIITLACVVVGGAAALAVAADDLPITTDDPPTTLRRPAVSGLPRQGETLTTSDGVWAGATPLTYRYQWRRCNATGDACEELPGATDARYT